VSSKALPPRRPATRRSAVSSKALARLGSGDWRDSLRSSRWVSFASLTRPSLCASAVRSAHCLRCLRRPPSPRPARPFIPPGGWNGPSVRCSVGRSIGRHLHPAKRLRSGVKKFKSYLRLSSRLLFAQWHNSRRVDKAAARSRPKAVVGSATPIAGRGCAVREGPRYVGERPRPGGGFRGVHDSVAIDDKNASEQSVSK
jgi:hypothetical protein